MLMELQENDLMLNMAITILSSKVYHKINGQLSGVDAHKNRQLQCLHTMAGSLTGSVDVFLSEVRAVLTQNTSFSSTTCISL